MIIITDYYNSFIHSFIHSFIQNPYIFNNMNAEALEGLDNHLDYNRWITSLARYRALMRQKGDKLTNKDVFQF
jgi:hypothetical protein